ncbi:permease for cytosine/purines, uracil, thiamine, allantoin-domain-containing protein [Aspergillus coremiiformis]|uniref:Permease for cytosine/purines, uracil, thiamine, allantoin-domain-containing protein n=1 Tax=Aspergillus coremiiformis TaxID=138285 RepID=A0A5N6Z4Q4_9EURO|nr:permease for cytosine/purines, uracil, thiamine, allantoin-domain-containing protein [Aspergillus coremiiformis]
MPSSFLTLRDALQVKSVDQDGNLRPVEALDNDSIRPTRAKERTWTSVTYMFFWFSATANVSNLYAASTGMTMGLTMWESIACAFGGQFLAGCLMAFNGRAGAVYRIPFPVLCRASFGHWGALWPTFNRAVMSIVWNGVNTVQGAQCLYVLLHAIFPSIENIPDKMGAKSALTSAQMMCFLVYWLINCAFLVIPVPKMKSLVYVKVFVYYAGALAMVGWVVALANGSPEALRSSSTVRGEEKSWVICRFFFLGLASCATFISNAADLQRYTRKPSDVILGQIVSFPLSGLLVAVLGNIIAASSKSVFGELIWNPLVFLDKLMAGERYTSGNRAACAFIALAFTYSTVFSAIFENSIPAGNDIAALWPRYLTVKRGFFICAVLSYAICPWYLLATASVFVNFLSSYQIFLSAITGILLCDYYVLRRGYLDIPSLYTANPDGIYRFYRGFNLRAFGAYVIAVAPNVYGFLHQMGVKAPTGIDRFYFVAYPVGLLIAFAIFFLACLLWAPKGIELSTEWREPKDYWDEYDPDREVVIQSVEVPEVVEIVHE